MRKELDVLAGDFNFEIRAYKKIEQFLLKKDIISIDTRDIISLGVSPCSKVSELVLKAKEILYKKTM